jgi:putative DNA primase/helicase
VPSAILKQARFLVQKDKKPYAPKDPTGPPAKWSNPKVFSDFDLARAVFNTTAGIDGIAFLTSPEFAAVDLDKCLDAHGQPSPAARDFIRSLPNSYWEKSSGGHGLHGYFRCTQLIENIPPTVQPDGLSVEFYAGKKLMNVTGWAVTCVPMAELKAEHIEPYRAKKILPATAPISAEPISQGARHKHLVSLAGTMQRRGMSTNAMGDALMRENLERCSPPLEEKAILGILESASKWPTVGDLVTGERKDVGNADRLLRFGNGNYRFVAAFDRWVVYDGARWPVEDKEQQTIRAEAHRMVRAYGAQASTAGDSEAMKFAAESLNSARISNMLREAAPHAILKVDEMDRDPLLINFRNGTLDARKELLREHRSEDYITALIPYDYSPEAPCPRWKKFIFDAFGQQKDLVEFFQRAVGYSMTGLTSEKCLFIPTGPTDSSKTTTMKVVGTLLGDYTQRIKVESLMEARRNQGSDNNAKDDLADLRGARFVPTSETGQAQRFREEVVKELTQGQGEYKAVRKYESHFTFPETWKIWMDCNHRPIVHGTDDAIWNRLVVIPFEHVVPKEKQIVNLAQCLVAEEAEGILAWMVRGLAAWRTNGLTLPAVMAEQRDQWRKESDDIHQWLEDKCIVAKEATAPGSALYASNKQWRGENGLWTESIQVFARKLREHGFKKKEVGKSKTLTWFGIGIKGVL